jgi:hypothetical protein
LSPRADGRFVRLFDQPAIGHRAGSNGLQVVAECGSNVFIRRTAFEGAKDALMLGRRFV